MGGQQPNKDDRRTDPQRNKRKVLDSHGEGMKKTTAIKRIGRQTKTVEIRKKSQVYLADGPGGSKRHEPARLQRNLPRITDKKKRNYGDMEDDIHEFEAHQSPELRPGIAAYPYVTRLSPWNTLKRGYDLEVGGSVTIALNKRADSRETTLVMVKQHSSFSEHGLKMLHQLNGDFFVNLIKAYYFEENLYVVSEYMPISLIQIIATPVWPTELEVSTIVRQVRFEAVHGSAS
jgi:hypothetical protein